MDPEMEDSDGGGRCGSPVYPCPSFSSYSSGGIADLASRVCREEAAADFSGRDDRERINRCEEDDHFEFVSVVRDSDRVAAFPVFNRELLADRGEEDGDGGSIRIPLKDLFLEDRDPPSCSSSEVDELDGVPEDSYCVWTPRSPATEQSPSPARCKKSNSTGSCSKRWRFRDLLQRSNSDGKDSFVFLTASPSSSPTARGHESRAAGFAVSKDRRSSSGGDPKSQARMGGGKAAKEQAAKEKTAASAHETFYIMNRALKEGDRRRSYLPYRKDLVGFFANVNGLGRSFPPF